MPNERYRLQFNELSNPVYIREVFARVERDLQSGKRRVTIKTFDGAAWQQEVQRSGTVNLSRNTQEIRYSCVQDLLMTKADHFCDPISLDKPRYRSYGPEPCQLSLTDATAVYEKNYNKWQQSATCEGLISYLKSVQLPVIKKIVCFGLGTLHADSEIRLETYHRQHALMQTLRTLISEQQKHDVQIFCQDPGYDTVDEEILKGLDMTIVDDPSGFLKVDNETFVISIYPDVCVRQIIADMPRPAAMLCNTVQPTQDLEAEWHMTLYEEHPERYPELADKPLFTVVDEEIVTTIRYTDPSSRRCREMVKEYSPWIFFPEDSNFGDNLTLYVRNW